MSRTNGDHGTRQGDDRQVTPLEGAVDRLDIATERVETLREDLRTARRDQRASLAALRVVAHQRPANGPR